MVTATSPTPSPLFEKVLKRYTDRSYKFTTTINHGGTIVCFAVDDQRQIFYAVLDLQTDDKQRGDFDVAFWPSEPSPVPFPKEIVQVGFSIAGATLLPDVHRQSLQEKPPGEIQRSDIHHFLSTTARLSSLSPIHVFSDGRYIFLFRQAIATSDSSALYKLEDGGCSADIIRPEADYIISKGNKVPIVNETLLCDVFVLVGTEIRSAREVRYRRSRHKTLPASNKDSLAATDMDGNKFFIPTQEFDFIRNLSGRNFSVMQLPTQVSGLKRWQVFVHNNLSRMIDMFNFEVAPDGLFLLAGSQLYTSPDPNHQTDVLERSPGTCPFTDKPLIPKKSVTGHAESCILIPATGGYATTTYTSFDSTVFSIEMWIKLDPDNEQPNGCFLFVSQSSNTDNKFVIDVNSDGMFRCRNFSSSLDLELAPTSTEWTHVSVTFDGKKVTGYRNGSKVASVEQTGLVFRFNDITIGANSSGSNSLNAYFDEIRVWNRVCTEIEIESQRHVRLVGSEPGLMSYWRLDEGGGTIARDQGSKNSTLNLQGNALFASSDCPIGDNSSVRRSSVGFESTSQRSISGGVSACLYYEQETVSNIGYGTGGKAMKKQARVMVTTATSAMVGDSDPAITALDFAVSREGRLAQVPDAVELPIIDVTESPQASLSNEQNVANLQNNITNVEREIRYRKDAISNVKRELEGTSLTTAQRTEKEGRLRAFTVSLKQFMDQWDLWSSEYRALSSDPSAARAFPLPNVHYDPSGLTVCAGLMKFAIDDGGSFLMYSATGHVTAYFRESQNGTFNVCHFDTRTERTRFKVSSQLVLQSRNSGNYGADKVSISPGDSDETCVLTIEEKSREIVETWANIPRDPAEMSALLNGTESRPDNVVVTNTLPSASTSGKSFLVTARYVGSDVPYMAPDGEASITYGLDKSWKTDHPGKAYKFQANTGLMALPSKNLHQTVAKGHLTIELWIKTGYATSFPSACLVHHVSDKLAYTVSISHDISETRKFFILIGNSSGTIENHKGEKILTSKQALLLDDWTHLAMRFRQSYALQFGAKQYIDCGKNAVLNITQDITIEAFVLFKTNRSQGLLGKGTLGKQGVPYQLSITNDRRIEFVFQDKNRNRVSYLSDGQITLGKLQRIAVTKKGGKDKNEHKEQRTFNYKNQDGVSQSMEVEVVSEVGVSDFFDILFYIDGVKVGTSRYSGEDPVGGSEPLEIGRCRTSIGSVLDTSGVISEVRLWDKALEMKDVGSNIEGMEPNLVCWWKFEEGEGKVANDFKNMAHGRIIGAEWIKNPDPQASLFKLYVNGLEMETSAPNTNNFWMLDKWGEPGFYIGCSQVGGATSRLLNGTLEEVRIWNCLRTEEQITDNLFTRLKGEKESLLAYYNFDTRSTAAEATQLFDSSLVGNNIPLPADIIAHPASVVSTAPISTEAPVVRSALLGTDTFLHRQIDGAPGVSEYADMQRDSEGNLTGVYKRCYSYLTNGEWNLFTGYKVGNLVTEWIGQAQFDPQVIGFIEGAPPVPTENLVMGTVDSADDRGIVELIDSEEVSYTVGASKEKSWDASFKAGGKIAMGSDDLLITAPLGLGMAKKVTDIDVNIGMSGNFSVENSWSQEEYQSQGRVRTRKMTVSTGGGFEDILETNQLNPVLGRRALPGNAGLALVQSSTADIFALRLVHNGALVSLRMLPNPDIPQDWNIISFPMNNRYTKQGTLDGRVGYDADGGVVLDNDYAGAASYGEYSYYKPKEAYRIAARIKRDEERLKSYYAEYDVGMGSTAGAVIGSAAGAAASLMIPGAGPFIAAKALDYGMNAINQASKPPNLAGKFAKRDMVNTYVWTADGGFFAESTESTESRTEVSSGSFNFKGAFGLAVDATIEVFSFGVTFEFEAAMGGSMSITKTKKKESSKSFSINASVDVPGRLQKYEMDDHGHWVGVFNDSGDPIIVAGKVDAYRFKTFYLDSSSENFEDLFEKVVDPIWFSESSAPNALALRQAYQSDKKPPCWRVFHRVTFVSRILPEVVTDAAAASMETVMKSNKVNSNWQLVQQLEPYVLSKRHDFALFADAIRQALRSNIPELVPYSADVVKFMAEYYGMDV